MGAGITYTTTELDSTDLSPTQFDIPRYRSGFQDWYPNIPGAVDWTGNFWGATVEYFPNEAECTDLGKFGGLRHASGRYPIKRDMLTVWSDDHSHTIQCPDDNITIGSSQFSHEYLDNDAYDDYTGNEYALLLQQHAPNLRFDLDDNYRADSPGTHANSPDTTLLVYVGGPSIQGPPWLEDLHATYFGMGDATESDLLDREPHGQEAALSQYQFMKDNFSELLGRAYGRVTHDNAGMTLLQYWLFYFHQEPIDTDPFVFDFGEHQGDWEMVTVRLDANLEPDRAFYAQHGAGGQYCEWPLVPHSLSTDQPDVYVAQTTHASYFSDGIHTNHPQDISDGDGDSFVPAVTPVTGADPAWMTWPGHWGGSQENLDLSTADSPPGPVFQTQWNGHDSWAANLDNACD